MGGDLETSADRGRESLPFWLTKPSESGHPCFVSHPEGETFSLSPRILLFVGF